MKKLVSALLALLLTLSVCAFADGETVRVVALNGPTGMGMVKMMKDEAENPGYQFSLESAPDVITPAIIKGEVDIACVPANLASVLFNKTQGDVQVLAVNTLGVLYIVERGDTIHTAEDLCGRTLYVSGKGATPEYAINYILTEAGLDPEKDVDLQFCAEHAECLTNLLANENAVAMLPQPFVTVAQTKASDLRVALDLTEEWDKLQEGGEAPSSMITGVVVARKAFVEANPDAVKAFLTEYAASVAYVNENVDEAAKLIGEYGIVAENVAKVAVPKCNIVCITGEEMKTKLSGYLNVLFAQNPAAVGGQLPDDGFYYADAQ